MESIFTVGEKGRSDRRSGVGTLKVVEQRDEIRDGLAATCFGAEEDSLRANWRRSDIRLGEMMETQRLDRCRLPVLTIQPFQTLHQTLFQPKIIKCSRPRLFFICERRWRCGVRRQTVNVLLRYAIIPVKRSGCQIGWHSSGFEFESVRRLGYGIRR